MGELMSEVTRRLPSLSDLNEIVRLLNIPTVEEVDLTWEARMHERTAVLLRRSPNGRRRAPTTPSVGSWSTASTPARTPT
jgi:hypothetical protein